MKLINNDVIAGDLLQKYSYYFDELNAAENIKELLSILIEQGYSIGKIEFIYVYDDCICKPNIEYADFDDFNENCYEIDKEDLRTIEIKMNKNGARIKGKVNIYQNLFEMFVKRNELELVENELETHRVKK